MGGQLRAEAVAESFIIPEVKEKPPPKKIRV